MQIKQQQELQRYLQQVHENIETVSISELLQAIMSQQPYLGQQSAVSSDSVVSTWSNVDQVAPSSAIYSTAGARQPAVPTRGDVCVPELQADYQHQQISSITMPPSAMTDSLHSESSVLSVAPGTTPSQYGAGLTTTDSWSEPVSDTLPGANTTDIAVIPDSLELSTEVAQTVDRSCSPSASVCRTNSLKEQVRPMTASSDSEVTATDQSVRVTVRRKQSAEAAILFAGVGDLGSSSPTSNAATDPPSQLPEVSSLGFVPIQNQPISSGSDSMDSMASSVAGSAPQQLADNSDLSNPSQPLPVKGTETKPSNPAAVTLSTSQRPVELLDTIQSLLGQFAASSSEVAAVGLSHSTAGEPVQHLQQSQAIIQQQQHQQLAAIASAIQNLQHLRSLQEAIGNLATALKTSQLQMLAALQVDEVGQSVPPPSVAAATMSTAVRPPLTAPVSACKAVHVSATAAEPLATPGPSLVAALVPEPPRGLPPPSQLTPAHLAALGQPQYPAAGGAASLLMQQQQQQLLLAMMQSAPYQQQHQQLLMQQLLNQNAVVMQGAAQQQQHAAPWQPVMMMTPAGAIRRPGPPPPMMPTQRLAVPPAPQPVLTPVAGTLPPPAAAALPVRSGAQTPVLMRPPPPTVTTASNIPPPLQTNLPDQR